MYEIKDNLWAKISNELPEKTLVLVIPENNFARLFFYVNTDVESVLEHKLCPFVLPTYFTLKISKIDAKRLQQIKVLTSAFYLILPHTIGPSNTLLLIIHCLLPAVKKVFSNGFFFSL